MPTKRITAYETTEDCPNDGGPILAIADVDGSLKFKTAAKDYAEGYCDSCNHTLGVSVMKIELAKPIYEES